MLEQVNLDDFRYRNAFLDVSPKARSMTVRIYKLNVIKMKNFYFTKSKRMSRQVTD